jgi:hypothetical protein
VEAALSWAVSDADGTYRNALIETSDSQVLFAASLVPTAVVEQSANAGDGQRFLINAPNDDAGQRSMRAILNWQQLLDRGRVAPQP